MGLLEELIQIIQEASSDGQQPSRPQVPAPASARPPPQQTGPQPFGSQNPQEIRRRLLAQQQRDAARQGKAPPQPAAADRTAGMAKTPPVAKTTLVAPKYKLISRATRLAHALRQPRTFADLIVLKELLDKPLCLRGGMRRR